jgi:lipopolysaccharide export system protein LptA
MSRPYFRNSLWSAAAIVLLVAGAGANAAEPAKNTDAPIVITADRMEAEKLGSTVTFIGSVLLKKEDMTLSSDHMVVYYDIGTKDIREIDASGHVVVRKDGRIALSQKAFYYSREEKIVLTGEARIIENEKELGGEKITLFMRDDRSVIEGGKVLLYQDKPAAKPGEPSKKKQE